MDEKLPRLMRSTVLNAKPNCKHDWYQTTINGIQNLFGPGRHLAVSHEECRNCGATKHDAWETNQWYEGM